MPEGGVGGRGKGEMGKTCGQKQVAEKIRQRRSCIAQRLSVPPGQTPVHTGDG